MGLFGGIIGSIFGGGGSNTTVTQQAANTTDVQVTANTTNQVLVDTSALAEAVAYVGELSNTGQLVLAAGIVKAAEEESANERAALDFIQGAWVQVRTYAVWGAIGLGIYLFFWPKGKK